MLTNPSNCRSRRQNLVTILMTYTALFHESRCLFLSRVIRSHSTGLIDPKQVRITVPYSAKIFAPLVSLWIRYSYGRRSCSQQNLTCVCTSAPRISRHRYLVPP